MNWTEKQRRTQKRSRNNQLISVFFLYRMMSFPFRLARTNCELIRCLFLFCRFWTHCLINGTIICCILMTVIPKTNEQTNEHDRMSAFRVAVRFWLIHMLFIRRIADHFYTHACCGHQIRDRLGSDNQKRRRDCCVSVRFFRVVRYENKSYLWAWCMACARCDCCLSANKHNYLVQDITGL